MSRLPVTTSVSGYPSATSVSRPLQVAQVTSAPTSVPFTSASPPTIRAAAPVVKSVSPTLTTSTGVRSVVQSGSVASASSLTSGAVRQAKVISSSTTPVSTYSGVSQLAATPYTASGTSQLTTTPLNAARVVKTATLNSETRPNTLAGPKYTQSAYEVKHKDDPQLQNLKELRKTCGLKSIPVSVGLQGFKTMASDGKLTREQFLGAYTLLLQSQAIEVPSDAIKNAVFDLFDRDDNNVVDMMEVICGVSLLCSGAEDDKIHAVFDIFDENGDGVITMDEMFKFLTSVFKVVLTPNVMAVMNSMGVTVESAEDLASVTALECFKTADLDQDGKLSVVEFKNWFYAPRNDPSFLFSPVRKLLQ